MKEINLIKIYRSYKDKIKEHKDRLTDDFIVFKENWKVKIKYTTMSWIFNSDWQMIAGKVKIIDYN